jgi:hypothetical protein
MSEKKKVWMATNIGTNEVILGTVKKAILEEIGVTARRFQLVQSKLMDRSVVVVSSKKTGVWKIEHKEILQTV